MVIKATVQAAATVRGVKNRKCWGRYAAWRYAEIRGASYSMYYICLSFEIRRGTKLLRNQAATQIGSSHDQS